MELERIEQRSVILEPGPRLFEFCPVQTSYDSVPKPLGLGMVSISKTSAARTQFGATWRIDACRIRWL